MRFGDGRVLEPGRRELAGRGWWNNTVGLRRVKEERGVDAAMVRYAGFGCGGDRHNHNLSYHIVDLAPDKRGGSDIVDCH